MAPDRRALFEAAFGALMIRGSLPQPDRWPAQGGAEQDPKHMSPKQLPVGTESGARAP
jgi:hypothetical protein